MRYHLRWIEPPANHARRPRILRKAKAALRDFIDRPTMLLPSLAFAARQGRKRERYQYIQRRHACVVVLEFLLHYTDIVTLRVGVQGNKVLGVSLETLAEQTGLNDRRLDRCIADLTAAGILTSYTRAEEVKVGTWRGRCAVRQIHANLFVALGLGDELHEARRWHYKRQAAVPMDPAARARMLLAARARQLAYLKSRDRLRPESDDAKPVGAHLLAYKPPD